MVFDKLKSLLGMGSKGAEDESEDKDNQTQRENKRYKPTRPIEGASDFPQFMVPSVGIAGSGIRELRENRYGYKATRNGLVRLIIPKGTKVAVPHPQRIAPGGVRKLRAEGAYVDKIVQVVGDTYTDADVSTELEKAAQQSIYDKDFFYEEGKCVVPEEPFDTHANNMCSSGIHFFASKQEAEEWFETANNIAEGPFKRRKQIREAAQKL